MIELLKSIAAPIVCVLASLISGIILIGRLRKKPGLKVGWYFLVLGTSIVFLLNIKPVSTLLVYSLESQYQTPPREVLEYVDILVLLSAGLCHPEVFADTWKHLARLILEPAKLFPVEERMQIGIMTLVLYTKRMVLAFY